MIVIFLPPFSIDLNILKKIIRFKRNLARHKVVHNKTQQNSQTNIQTEQQHNEIRQTRQACFQTDSGQTENPQDILINENPPDAQLLNPQNDQEKSMSLILCTICNKKFNLRIQLKKHMLKDHNKLPGKIFFKVGNYFEFY